MSSRKSLHFFDENAELVSSRIATGLHKIGLAMKQQAWQQANEEGLSATQGQILAALVAHGPLTGETKIMNSIPGYSYGTTAVATSPVTLADFEQTKASVLFGEEDVTSACPTRS